MSSPYLDQPLQTIAQAIVTMAGERSREPFDQRRNTLARMIDQLRAEQSARAGANPRSSRGRPYEDPDLPETWGEVDTRYLGWR